MIVIIVTIKINKEISRTRNREYFTLAVRPSMSEPKCLLSLFKSAEDIKHRNKLND